MTNKKDKDYKMSRIDSKHDSKEKEGEDTKVSIENEEVTESIEDIHIGESKVNTKDKVTSMLKNISKQTLIASGVFLVLGGVIGSAISGSSHHGHSKKGIAMESVSRKENDREYGHERGRKKREEWVIDMGDQKDGNKSKKNEAFRELNENKVDNEKSDGKETKSDNKDTSKDTDGKETKSDKKDTDVATGASKSDK